MYEVFFINTLLGIIFQDGGGLIAIMIEAIFLIVLLILLTASAVMAFHVFTLPSSHLRETHTSINLKVQETM